MGAAKGRHLTNSESYGEDNAYGKGPDEDSGVLHAYTEDGYIKLDIDYKDPIATLSPADAEQLAYDLLATIRATRKAQS